MMDCRCWRDVRLPSARDCRGYRGAILYSSPDARFGPIMPPSLHLRMVWYLGWGAAHSLRSLVIHRVPASG